MPSMQMKNQNKARFKARASVLKALAHPTRLFMVEELAKRPHCVNELTEMVEVDISTVSKHLSILREVDLIYDVKEGKWVNYYLNQKSHDLYSNEILTLLQDWLPQDSLVKKDKYGSSPP